MTARDVRIQRCDDVIVAHLEGEIDLANTPMILTQILQAVAGDAIGLVVDLSGVRYMDSVGVHMLFRLIRTLLGSGQGLAIVMEGTSPLRKLLKITNLDEAAALRASIDECIEALRNHPTMLH